MAADRPLTTTERRVVDAVAEQRDEIVDLLCELIAFDTTARLPGEPARDERPFQEHLAERLRARGAVIDLWEPSPEELAGHRLVPNGLDFAGRPQLAARFPGAGGGRSLLLDGHVDAVSYEPRDAWSGDPLRAAVRDGVVTGRGACDMKGGIAAMTVAAETLADLDVRLAGDLLVCANSDEESSGAGAAACVARGIRADAGIVTEPTGGETWIACRGSTYVTVTVPGRPGHAELAQPHWRDGGPVNAIERALPVLASLTGLRERWAGLRHAHLSPPTVVPTLFRAGEWAVTHPASASFTAAVCFLPCQADADGWSGAVEQEIAEAVQRAAAADDWLAETGLGIAFETPVNPYELDPGTPIVGCLLGAARDAGRPSRLGGLDSWFDAATFTAAGTPCVGYGPGEIEVAHTVDEHVAVDDLVSCAQVLALAALRWCGAPGD